MLLNRALNRRKFAKYETCANLHRFHIVSISCKCNSECLCLFSNPVDLFSVSCYSILVNGFKLIRYYLDLH